MIVTDRCYLFLMGFTCEASFEYGIGVRACVWKSCQTEYNEFRLICQSVVLCSMDFFCSFVTVSLIINCSKWKVLRWTHACICCSPVYKCMPGERVNQKNLTVFFSCVPPHISKERSKIEGEWENQTVQFISFVCFLSHGTTRNE